ncbi:MAG: alpha/beta hydrolase [Woeseia sp.]
MAASLWLADATAAEDAGAPAVELADCRISAGPGFPGIKARCGKFLRPLDPEDPASTQLELRVAVVPALSLDPEPDPLVPIAGGPGQASREFYAAYSHAFQPVQRNRDIVLLDQRGTGESEPLECATDEEVLAGQLSQDQVRDMARQCVAALPHDPRFFTTSVAVADLEALRAALGYPSFNIYGVSYGTRVAQHFARRYPESARTLILDGVLPPQIALGPEIATEAQKALEAIFDRCAESQPCNARFPVISEQFALLRARLAVQPAEVVVPDPVTWKKQTLRFGHDELAGALRILSYHPNTVALMPLLIQEAADEYYEPLAAQFLMASRSLAQSLSIGMHNAVVCTEDAPFFSRERISRESLEATYIGAVQLDALTTMCSVWPRGVLHADFREPLETDIPVLLLSGDADPVTPPRFAEMAAVRMSNSRHLVGVDQGHGQAARTCIPEIMSAFIDSASLADLDEDCLVERQFAMPFFLDYTGPSP